MRQRLPARFWLEAITSVIGLTLFVLTLITREWFELLTGWDPDRGSGALELALPVALLAIAAASMLAARRDHRLATANA